MAHNIHWYTDQVLYSKVWGNRSIEEMYDTAYEILELIAPIDAPLMLVFDMTDLPSMPNDINQTYQAVKPVLNEPKIAHIVLVGTNNSVIRFVVTLLSKLGNRSIIFIDQPEELDALIERFNHLNSTSV